MTEIRLSLHIAVVSGRCSSKYCC